MISKNYFSISLYISSIFIYLCYLTSVEAFHGWNYNLLIAPKLSQDLLSAQTLTAEIYNWKMCAGEDDVPEIIKILIYHKIPNKKNIKEWIRCYVQKMNWISEEGIVYWPAYLEKMSDKYGNSKKVKSQVLGIIKECSDKTKFTVKIGEFMFELLKCVIQEETKMKIKGGEVLKLEEEKFEVADKCGRLNPVSESITQSVTLMYSFPEPIKNISFGRHAIPRILKSFIMFLPLFSEGIKLLELDILSSFDIYIRKKRNSEDVGNISREMFHMDAADNFDKELYIKNSMTAFESLEEKTELRRALLEKFFDKCVAEANLYRKPCQKALGLVKCIFETEADEIHGKFTGPGADHDIIEQITLKTE